MEYATVAMRYEAIDYVVDRQSGDVVEGDPNTPSNRSRSGLSPAARTPSGRSRRSRAPTDLQRL